MPKRTDIKTIMIIGSGPIIIGQACEFDYSGTQACKALREEGYRIVLLNSNPATVMTDPGFSDRTYLEPVNIHMASAIIRKERPDAILPNLGGQTALNLAMELHNNGVLEEYGVEMIGAKPEAIEVAENRQSFREAMQRIGLDLPASGFASSVDEAMELVKTIGFPAIVRPSYTLGGTGGGVAYNLEEFRDVARAGLLASPIRQVLVEESVLGWKEMEMEIMRDAADNSIVICGIENFDPMGIHTGDSITVAPILTLSDPEYQALRDDSFAIARAVGVNSGGCNVQFAIDPKTGRRVVIEMNPRVSRSSALASKATGIPIARITAKLAVGYTLDELKNDITGTSACFEPSVDYCVVKVPRFTYEKFEGADTTLGLSMHSVGETMALGANFREALQKALRGLETGLDGLEAPVKPFDAPQSKAGRLAQLTESLYRTGPDRLLELYEALSLGLSLERAHEITGIDPWFLHQLDEIRKTENRVRSELLPLVVKEKDKPGDELRALWRHVKAQGFSDARIAKLAEESLPEPSFSVENIREFRLAAGVTPFFRCVDTCAGEFRALTPYFYSTFDATHKDPGHEKFLADKGARSVMILGGGPNRIGQGIEFDYCCVQAAFTLRERGITTIMVNSNPETVSTDFDTADRLYFEPLTVEDILAIYEVEKPEGLMVQFGGQTPLNLARALQKAGVPILGTQPEGIALAEDRDSFSVLAAKLGVPQPASGIASNEESACRIANEIGYPVMVRPSFVLGGRAMRTIHDEASLREYVGGKNAYLKLSPSSPILVDKFLEDAIEVDVDAVVDGTDVTIAAIMEHIEQAGIHSGDSCCSIPTHTLGETALADIRKHTKALGLALGTKGLLNMQFAVHQGLVYIIEANPRASRTVPFVSKAIGTSVAGIATRVMVGETLAQIGFTKEPTLPYYVVKEAVFPFDRFPGAVINLGPEMRSTGEVMGIDRSFGMAFLKAQSAANTRVPLEGNVILSVSDRDKAALVPLAARLAALGFTIYATPGTRDALADHGIVSETVVKIGPQRPHLLDLLRNGDIDMIVNTVSGTTSARDASPIRSEAILRRITLITTITALAAAVEGLETRQYDKRSVAPLQDYYTGVVV